MAVPSPTGKYVKLVVHVWYDPSTKRVRLTSNDLDLPREGIHTICALAPRLTAVGGRYWRSSASWLPVWVDHAVDLHSEQPWGPSMDRDARKRGGQRVVGILDGPRVRCAVVYR